MVKGKWQKDKQYNGQMKNDKRTKNIKYKLWVQRLDIQTNYISISISLGLQKFSENTLLACVKHNTL
jgi:hypothetical protein